MARLWNGKALCDELGQRLWDTSSTFRTKILRWIAEIQDDLTSEMPLDYYKFRLKKLLPTEQELISLDVEIPGQSTAIIATGGALTDGTKYKVYVTFIVWDEDNESYIESKPSIASSEVTGTATDLTIALSAIPTYSGDTSVKPATIWRRVYVSKQASTDTAHGEPFYSQDIQDNTTTTLNITSEPTSTRTPPSDSEIDQLCSDNPILLSSGKILMKVDMAKIRRYNPSYSESATPDSFDFVGARKINLYPRLSSAATTAQRTLIYHVYRRPHEVFYDVDCPIDIPIGFKKALTEGVVYKAYEYRDRDGAQSKLLNYYKFKEEAYRKLNRTKGRASSIRDVNGDCNSFEV